MRSALTLISKTDRFTKKKQQQQKKQNKNYRSISLMNVEAKS